MEIQAKFSNYIIDARSRTLGETYGFLINSLMFYFSAISVIHSGIWYDNSLRDMMQIGINRRDGITFHEMIPSKLAFFFWRNSYILLNTFRFKK